MPDKFIDYVFYRMWQGVDNDNPLLMFYHPELSDNVQEMMFNIIYKKSYFILNSIQLNFKRKFLIKKHKAACIIQKGCHNWLYAPICKDGTIGINCKIGWKLITNHKTQMD